jgi:outer membrane usher protein
VQNLLTGALMAVTPGSLTWAQISESSTQPAATKRLEPGGLKLTLALEPSPNVAPAAGELKTDEQASLPGKGLRSAGSVGENTQASGSTLSRASEPSPAPATSAEDVEFDTDFLLGKGFRNMNGDQQRRLAYVRPGPMAVEIFRNGSPVGRSTVLFTTPPGRENGSAKPCLTPALITELNVKPSAISPKGQALLSAKNSEPATRDAATCLYLEDWVDGASANYDKGELQLKLSIPQAYLARQGNSSVSAAMLSWGENAGFVNYNANHYQTQGATSNFLGLNAGVNIEGWQLRHTSFLTQSSGAQATNQFSSGETFVRRPLLDWKSSLALGDTNSFSPVIGGVPLRGLRLSSDEGMMSDEERAYRPVIRGIARSNARVRILQNKVVFLEQNVPPGPFELTEINPPAALGNLEVTVTEADGSQQTFTEPYSVGAGKLNPGSYRYSASVGNYRANTVSGSPAPVLQAYLRYGLNKWLSPGAEVLLSPNYSNLGLQAGFSNPLGTLAFNSLYAQARGQSSTETGNNFNLNYTARALGPFYFFGGLTAQSRTYVTPTAALSGAPIDFNKVFNLKSSRYVSMSLNLKSYGSLSLSMLDQTNWGRNTQSTQYRASYNATWQQVYLNAYISQSQLTDSSKPTNSFGFSMTIPSDRMAKSGAVSVNYSKTDNSDASRLVSYAGNLGQDNTVYYNLSQSQTGDTATSGGSLGYSHPWGSLGANLSSSNNGPTQTGLSATGAVVFHRDGFIMAPSLGGTFAIVEVPNGKGVGLQGSRARVNGAGFGVVPSLSPYYLNDVQINLENASIDLEIDNAGQKIAPVEGAIVRLKYETIIGRPLLLRLAASSGERIPIGATVSNSQGLEVGTVGQGSRALVRVPRTQDTLKVVWGEKPTESCTTQYAVGEQAFTNASGYTSLDLPCTVGAASKELPARSAP